MNRVDRSDAFARLGRSLVTDPLGWNPANPAPPAPPTFNFGDDDFIPKGLRAWAGRSEGGVHVQGLIDAEGTTYVSLIVNGECETREFSREQALDAYLHPFAYGFTLPL